jgi:hypothetical protein
MPFDYQHIIPFICVLSWQIWISVYHSFHEVSTSGLLQGLVMILASEFQIIGDSMKNIDFKNGLKDLKRIIDKHQELIKIADELESIFSISNFTNITSSVLMSCFTILECFKLQRQDLLLIIYLMFLIILTNQIFLLCYYCQKLETASESVGEKLMESNWYELEDPKMRKVLIFTLMRNQKPVKLTFAKFIDINLQTFQNVSRYFKFWANFRAGHT